MTRISVKDLVDDMLEEGGSRLRNDSLERRAREMIMTTERDRRRKERSLESRARQMILIMDGCGRVRDRSPGSREGESPSKRRPSVSYNEESLVFETCLVDRDGVEQTVGALGVLLEEAVKLSWKQFKNYMIRNSGIEKSFPRKTEVKVFYVDEEQDEIFVDTDDEYKELLRLAAEKNKDGFTMILKFISISKTRRSKVDLLARESKTSPGKVTKKQPSPTNKHFTSEGLAGKVWKINSSTSSTTTTSKRGLAGSRVVNKPIKVTVGLSKEVKGRVETMEDITYNCPQPREQNLQDTNNSRGSVSSGVSSYSSSPCSGQSTELLKQRASVFDWISKNTQQPKEATPTWFNDYMENYKDELTAEITAKVVQSLGVVLDNKLSGLLSSSASKRSCSPCCFSEQGRGQFVKEKRGGSNKKERDNKKVKKEAMRMTMEINEESKESKELKKLKKSLIKKTDKVVKVAMKIEKKNQQGEKARKPSLTQSSSSDLGMKSQSKRDKKEKKEDKKAKKDISKKAKNDPQEEDVQASLADHPLSMTKIIPETKSSEISDEMLKCSITSEDKAQQGRLTPALFLLEENCLFQKSKPGATVLTKVKLINMGGLPWKEGKLPTAQRSFSSDGLLSEPETSLPLPSLRPGEEGSLMFQFTTPSVSGMYEAVWHFFQGMERFGPALKFKIEVVEENRQEDNAPSAGTEMTDFGGEIDLSSAVEMRGMGSSARSQEMVEMSSRREIITIHDEVDDSGEEEGAEEDEDEEEEEDKCTFADEDSDDTEFDLLAKEVDTLTIISTASSCQEEDPNDDDFEVIALPSCFNLDIPFELVDDVSQSGGGEKPKEPCAEDKKPVRVLSNPLEESKETMKLVEEKLCSTEEALVNTTSNIDIGSVERLVELGFANREENITLLNNNNNNLEKVLEKLFTTHGRNWAGVRH